MGRQDRKQRTEQEREGLKSSWGNNNNDDNSKDEGNTTLVQCGK